MAVVVANIVHLLWPVMPLAFYQVIAGVILALIPDLQTLTLDPELFMILIIAPLMFNEGQNASARQLTRNFHQIMSLAVYLAVITVLIVGVGLHLTLPTEFPLAVAFMLAAIITPTDAVAVKSLTVNVKMPTNVNDQLEQESLFNDASGLVLMGLATASLRSGSFSMLHGIGTFLYVFFCAIIFGTIAGILLIKLRTALMRSHVDLSTIVIPLNILTPIVVYWLAKELKLSGILAVVATGVTHSILRERLQLTSTKVQVASATLWTIIADALNGIVFVFLGLSLPRVLSRMGDLPMLRILVIAIACYLVMTLLRYLWARWGLVKLNSARYQQDLNQDSWLLAIGGIHGTITMAMAFSIPGIVNQGHPGLRATAILIAALVILISLLVGAVVYPKVLPATTNSYTPTEFAEQLNKTVRYAIKNLSGDDNVADKEQSLVIDQLASQANMSLKMNGKRYEQIAKQCQQVEMDNLEQMLDDGQISPEAEERYLRLIVHLNVVQGHGNITHALVVAWRRLKWRFVHHRHVRRHWDQQREWTAQLSKIAQANLQAVNIYLNSIQNSKNAAEVAAVRHVYLARHQILARQDTVDRDKMNQTFIYAFQLEHSYIQQQAAAGNISSELANALNEQVSTSQLVYLQSLE